MRNILDVLFRRKPTPDDRDAEMNALQVKSDMTLARVDKLVRLASIDAQVGAQAARRR